MSRDPMSDARPGPRAGAFVLLLCTAVVAGRPALAATPIPRIIAVHVLDDVALPLPADARAASHALGFRMGGLSDLVVIAGADGHEELWCVTDRGPNGMVPKPGSDPAAPDMLRTLPVPEFVPLLVRLELPSSTSEDAPGVLRIVETRPIVTAAGKATSGRPAVGPPRGKPMVDPATARTLPIDPDGIDSEGLAPAPGGGFWVAEEYAPSLLLLDAHGRVVRRLVPSGVAIEECGCDVAATLPERCARRQDNRGFEALAASPDGALLFAMLQSPTLPAEGDTPEERIRVPLTVLDADSGSVHAVFEYRLGDPGQAAEDVAAEDGKISCMAASAGDRLLVLEQSTIHSRIYEITVPSTGSGDLPKTLVADLAPLAAGFAADISPGSAAAPSKLSDLKFEGLALLSTGEVALVNDNDFDMDAAGAAPASPPIRRTCLWILDIGIPAP